MANNLQVKFQPAEGPRPDCGGPSLLEQMWAALLEEMDRLMPGGDHHADAKPTPTFDTAEARAEVSGWEQERARIQGACQGITACIALVLNPYRPNPDEVRTEAVTRWEDRQALYNDGLET